MNLPVSSLGVLPAKDASLECIQINPQSNKSSDGNAHSGSNSFGTHRIDLDPSKPFSLATLQHGVRQGVGLEWLNNTWCAKAWSKSSPLCVNQLPVFEAPLKEGDYIETDIGCFRFLARPSQNPLTLTSKNAKFADSLKFVDHYARTDFPVLISGPSGSGKELLARQIHDLSSRSSRPYVALNCSALSESLIESELFGHIKGAFTGAQGNRLGAFEAARGGTLFLDEIGDLPLPLQPKLLRALENSEIRPVGSDRPIRTDVRILAATHKNLVEAVRAGRFREDLYWRLQVCTVNAPALKDRPEDLTDLIYHFCRKYRVGMSLAALDVLRNHRWPGNIRELKNVICRASAIGRGRQIEGKEAEALICHLDADTRPFNLGEIGGPESRSERYLHGPHFHSTHTFTTNPTDFKTEAARQQDEPDSTAIEGGSSQGFVSNNVIVQIERDLIIRRLKANNGNQRKTALELGIPKSTLHDRISAYNITCARRRARGKPNSLQTSPLN